MAGRGFGRWGKRHPEGQWTIDRPGVTLALGAMSWKAAGDPDSEGEARRRGVMGLRPGFCKHEEVGDGAGLFDGGLVFLPCSQSVDSLLRPGLRSILWSFSWTLARILRAMQLATFCAEMSQRILGGLLSWALSRTLLTGSLLALTCSIVACVTSVAIAGDIIK